ncbi:MAG: hypothetical protein Q9157_004577 [Trypethelium eluteriae]
MHRPAMPQHTDLPRDSRRAEDAELGGVVHHQRVVVAEPQPRHRRREVCGRGKHVWVGRRGVGDGVEVEEAGAGEAAGEVGGAAGALLGVVREEPGAAEGDEARIGGGRGGLERGVEFAGVDEVGVEGTGRFG